MLSKLIETKYYPSKLPPTASLKPKFNIVLQDYRQLPLPMRIVQAKKKQHAQKARR
jgi:hypothetical protein